MELELENGLKLLTLPRLYKKDTKGALRMWEVTINPNGSFTCESGLIGGNTTVSKPKVCKGKNIGKSNETTPFMQAQYEARAKWEKKLKDGYSDDKNSLKEDSAEFFQCMLAQEYGKRLEAGKVTFPAIAQPKLDGIRCITSLVEDVVITKSRRQTPITAVPHINSSAENLLKANDWIEALDGELYNHDLKEDFQELTSCIRKTSNLSPEVLAKNEKYIQYHVYDVVCTDKSLTYSERMSKLREAIKEEPTDHHIKIVYFDTVKDEAAFDKFHAEVLAKGYEGSMLRSDKPYEEKRSFNLLKRKDFQDMEVKVTSIEEGTGNWAGYAKIIHCEWEGKNFKSNIKGNQAYLKQVLAEKDYYVGKSATLKFFRFTDDGIPYLPYVINLAREDYDGM